MARLSMTQAFAILGAKPTNARWSCSEIASDKSLVFCGWDHLLKKQQGRLYYEDRLSRWTANRLGKEHLRKHLVYAKSCNATIRLIVAVANNQAAVDAGEGSRIRKEFVPCEHLVGRMTSFDGDRFVFDFAKA